MFPTTTGDFESDFESSYCEKEKKPKSKKKKKQTQKKRYQAGITNMQQTQG